MKKKDKKLIKKLTRRTVMTCVVSAMSVGVVAYYSNKKINELKNEYNTLMQEHERRIEELQIYETLYKDTTEELAEARDNYEEASSKLAYLEESIKLSKEEDEKYNRTNFADKDLTKYPIYTVEEMNEWIAERAPENSSFIGKGEEFLKASQESNLDPRYLIAHAALESGWGTSSISRDKNNFYGISAYNHDPYNSAKSFQTSCSGIIAGAKWIYENYTSKGQNTLNKMIWGKKSYCVENDGTPSQSWIDKIVNIIYQV